MLLREDHFERWLALCFEHQTVEISGLKYTSRHTQLPTKNVNNVAAFNKSVYGHANYYYYKDLFTHKDINTYINDVV